MKKRSRVIASNRSIVKVMDRPEQVVAANTISTSRYGASFTQGNFLWDFFLAHAQADKEAAESLYELLRLRNRVFLASHCLQLGDDWDSEIAKAQRLSRITVVLVSIHSEAAYYQREEIATAIDMAGRDKDKYRVVPIYLGTQLSENATIPYGLRLKQGLTITGLSELAKAAKSLVELLDKINGRVYANINLARYTKLKRNDNIVTKLFKEVFESFPSAINWITNSLEVNFFSRAGQAYTEQLEKRYNSVRVLGMREPMLLRNIYTRVNILEKITAQQRISLDELEQYFDRDRRGFGIARETKEGNEIVNTLSKFIVLGKPGAGKTTFLRYTILQAADGALKEQRVPVFISLKQWSDSNKSLMDFIIEQFDTCHFPQAGQFIDHLLQAGRCLLLFDGLDEVSTTKQDPIISEIQAFTDKYSANQFILSCRIAAYSYCFEHFTDVEMADFNDGQIESFIYSWFVADQEKAKLCWKELEANPPIKELASVPLLLTLLCLAFDETMKFPKNRSELYREAIDALLKKWDVSRKIVRQEIYKNLSLIRKESLFSRIAAITFEAGQYFIPQRTLERAIADFIRHLPGTKEEDLEPDSEAILKAIEAQHGIFVERARGIYSFSHLTFQEYFTAKYVVDNAEKGALKELVKNHLTEDRWIEVFLIAVGALFEADNFLLQIKAEVDSLLPDNLSSILNNIKRWLDKDTISVVSKYSLTGDAPILISLFLRSYTLAHALSHAQDLDRARDLALDLFRACDLAQTSTLIRVRDFARERARARVRLLDRNRNLVRAFDRNFRKVLDLENYLKANLLLVNCLNTECYVSKEIRQKILRELLTVPKALE
ncbi:MAG: NACHT domain-containing protein [Acidobacteriota bacterium]